MKAIYPDGRIISCRDGEYGRLSTPQLQQIFKGWFTLLYVKTEHNNDMFFVMKETYNMQTLPPFNKKASKMAGRDIYGMVLYVREIDIK